MKNIIAILLTLSVMVACKTADPCLRCPQTSTTETVTKEILVPVQVPADSVLMQALLRCDSAGNVVLDELTELKSSSASTALSLQGNRMRYVVIVKHDTIYVPVTNTYTAEVKTVTLPPTIIATPIPWWKRLLMYIGGGSVAAMAVYILMKLKQYITLR